MRLDLCDVFRLAHHHHLIGADLTRRPFFDELADRPDPDFYVHDLLFVIGPGITHFRIPFALQIIGDGSAKWPDLLCHCYRGVRIDHGLENGLFRFNDIAAVEGYYRVMFWQADMLKGRQDRVERSCGDKYDRDTFICQGLDRLYGLFANGMIRLQEGAIHVQEYSFIHAGTIIFSAI